MKRAPMFFLFSALSVLSTLSAQDSLNDPHALAELLKKEMKDARYSREILPNNFSHLIQLLNYGTQTNQKRAYALLVLRRFTNMIKGAEYVNASAAASMLEQLDHAIKPYININYANLTQEQLFDFDMFDKLKFQVNNSLYTSFCSDYESFKANPETFLDTLSGQISSLAQEHVSVEQIKQATIRFLEVVLGKLIWAPEDQDKTWTNVNTLSNHLATLMESNIIDDIDNFDDLNWSIVHRYCYFIDVTGSTLSTDFYQEVKHDLATKELLLLDTEEKNTCIESKQDCLARALVVGEAKSRGNQHGLIIG